MRLFRTIMAAAALGIAALAWGGSPEADAPRSLVFNPGDYGSKFYRIPGLTTARDGSIVAVADKRIENQSDLPGRIDVVARRSTDGGLTWSDYITVAENNEDGGYGDPAIVTDSRTGDILVISSHGNGLWQKAPAHISISRSKDNGLTWEAPVDINPQIAASIPGGGDAYEAWFASSGRALQLRDGRIMFALVTRKPDVKGFPIYAVYSDDGGYTWKVSDNAGTLDGDESKLVELKDGTLIMSIRNRWKGPRIFSYSSDRGRTWSEPTPVADLPDPGCNGDIMAVGDLLLQTMPGHPRERQDVTVWVSEDQGKTWPHRHRLVRAPSAYSSMTVLPDGRIGFLIEEEGTDPKGGYRLWFTALPMTELVKK